MEPPMWRLAKLPSSQYRTRTPANMMLSQAVLR
jgi:hypothetical protein